MRVFETGASKWDKIATRLHFDANMIAQIQTDAQGTFRACRSAFSKWLEGKKGLREPRTWSNVIEILAEAGLGQLSEDLRETLLSGKKKQLQ